MRANESLVLNQFKVVLYLRSHFRASLSAKRFKNIDISGPIRPSTVVHKGEKLTCLRSQVDNYLGRVSNLPIFCDTTALQEESRADWSSAIVEVKRSFQCFQELLNPQAHLINGDGVVPEEFDEWISTSAEGNILEATNLAVNVLENHYKNCNFNTTGQQIVIVSPGAGVFE
uniref:Vacuolar membrane-associated protein Iml1 N-terminal domain-containing protein n=1 Tax=Amphimedon queenslandica TaxID=400682 RepID=A0A1X7SYP5_AMPQE